MSDQSDLEAKWRQNEAELNRPHAVSPLGRESYAGHATTQRTFERATQATRRQSVAATELALGYNEDRDFRVCRPLRMPSSVRRFVAIGNAVS
jgi:hypothetical protein